MRRLVALIASLIAFPAFAQTIVLITAVPTPGGIVSSKYRDGDDGTPAIPLTWATIGPFTGIIEGATPCYDLRTYLTEPGTPDATLSLVGSVANWSLSTDDLCYDGTGVSSGTLIARATRDADVSDSLSFAVSSVAASGADTTPPTIVTGLSIALNGSNKPVLTFDAAADVRVSGEDVSGLDTFTPYRGATPLTETAYTGTGLAPTFTSADVGTLSPVGTSTQDDADWQHTAEGQFNTAAEEYRGTCTDVTGDFTATVKVVSITNGANSSRSANLMVRESGTLPKSFRARIFPSGNARAYYRSTEAGTVSTTGVVSGVLPGWMQIQRSGTTLTARASSDGNAWQPVHSMTLGLASTASVCLATFSEEDGVATTVEYENFAITSRPQQTYTDSAASDGATHSYTVVSTDVANITAAANAPVSIVVPPDEEPPPSDTETPDYSDPVSGVTVSGQSTTPVADSAALTTALGDQDCGETLSLANGTYTGSRSITASCPSTTPFIVKCANALQCTATGQWTMTGARNIVTGMLFDGAVAGVVLQGTNNKVIANEFTNWGEVGDTSQFAVVASSGTTGEIAYNEFHDPGPYNGTTNNSLRIGIRTSEGSTGSSMHFDVWVHHNLFRDFPAKAVPSNYGSSQDDAIELCQTGRAWHTNTDVGWYIEDNLVLRHLQGHGVFDVKCPSGVVVRRNTFTNSVGSRIDFRHNGQSSILESNYLEDGAGAYIGSRGHKIVCNTVIDSGQLRVKAGTEEWDSGGGNSTGHPRAYQVDVSGNTGSLLIGWEPSGATLPASSTRYADHSGPISFGSHTGTTGSAGAAALYECSPAVRLTEADVGPDELAAASSAYKAARGLN